MKTLTIYTKPGCGYCAQAKDHLKKLGLSYEEIDITADASARDMLVSQGHKTLPVLFAGDKLLVPGGYSSLKTMKKEDILKRLQ